MKGKFYCTYKWRELFGNHSSLRAIECESYPQAVAVAQDIYAYNGTIYVNINKCGRLPKNTKIISYQDYKKGLID